MTELLNIFLGLGLFIVGLRKLPSSIQKIMVRLKYSNLIELNGILLPYLVGIILSILFQASSVAVVFMMIYMVYSRVKFKSAYAFMLGATLGTSLKFWIVAPEMKIIAACLILVSQLLIIFTKSYKLRNYCTALGWLGIIFLGWAILKDGTTQIFLTNKVSILSFVNEYTSSIQLYSIGALLTAIVQSSSLIIKLTSEVISSSTDLYNVGLITLGANVGTTITALVVSIWLPTKSKQLAFAHFGIKFFGTLLCFITYQTFLSTIDTVFITPFALMPKEQVFAIHSGFNIFNSLAFLLLCPIIDKVMNNIITDKKAINIDEDTFLTKSLIQLLSNVPKEGISEAKKQFKHLSFNIKSFEDKIVQSFTSEGIRSDIASKSTHLVSQMRSVEELLLIIRHRHSIYSTEAHELLIDFYRLRKILQRQDYLNKFIQDLTREEIDESVKLVNSFISEWEDYRGKVWLNIFKTGEKSLEIKSQAMTSYFLKDHNHANYIRPQILTHSYRLGLFLIGLAESWELLLKHQQYGNYCSNEEDLEEDLLQDTD